MSRYFVASIVASAVLFGLASAASLQVGDSFDTDEVEILRNLNNLINTYSTRCIQSAVYFCLDKFNEQPIHGCMNDYVEEHKNSVCDQKGNYVPEIFRVVDESDDERVSNMDRFTIKEIMKIAKYLWKLADSVPTTSYVKIIFACKKSMIFEHFKACADNYIANNEEQLLDTRVAESEDIVIQETIKIIVYLIELVRKVPIECYGKVFLTCGRERIFDKFIACAEDYISSNPVSCAASAEIDEFSNQVTEAKGASDILWHIMKTAKYLYELSKRVPAACFLKVAISCRAERSYANFKDCADFYVATHPTQCARPTDGQLGASAEAGSESPELELFEVASYIRRLQALLS